MTLTKQDPQNELSKDNLVKVLYTGDFPALIDTAFSLIPTLEDSLKNPQDIGEFFNYFPFECLHVPFDENVAQVSFINENRNNFEIINLEALEVITSLFFIVFKQSKYLKFIKMDNIYFVDRFIISGLIRSPSIKTLKLINSQASSIIIHVLPYNPKIKNLIIDEGDNMEENLEMFQLFSHDSISLKSVQLFALNSKEIFQYIQLLEIYDMDILNLKFIIRSKFPTNTLIFELNVKKTNIKVYM